MLHSSEQFGNLTLAGTRQRLRDWRMFGGVLVFLILTWWLHTVSGSTDHLINFAPANSLTYVHVRGAHWPGDVAMNYFPVNRLLALRDNAQVSSFTQSQDISEVSAWAVPADSTVGMNWGIMIRFLGEPATQRFLNQFPVAVRVAPRTVLLATSDLVAQSVGAGTDTVFSLADLVKNSQPAHGQVQGFWRVPPEFITEHFLDSGAVSLLQFAAQPAGRHWRVAIVGVGGENFFAARSPLIKNIPANSMAAFSGISLNTVLSIWQTTSAPLNNFAEVVRASYPLLFDNQPLDATALRAAADLVLTVDPQQHTSGVLLALPIASDRQAAFRHLLELVVAVAQPQAQLRQIDAATRVTELRTAIEQLSWQTLASSTDWQLEALRDRQGIPVVGYARSANNIMVASDPALLGQVMDGQGWELASLTRPCFSGEPGDGQLVLRVGKEFPNVSVLSSLLPNGTLTLRPESNDKLSGCFWLE